MDNVSDIMLRQAKPQDLDELIRVTDEARAALGALGIDQWQGGTPRKDTLINDISQGWTWVAVDAREPAHVLGCMAVCGGGEADYDNITSGAWLTSSPNTLKAGVPTYSCIHRVAVANEARRKGIASMMVEAAKHMSAQDGFMSVRVDTHAGNLPMQHVLEKAGFTRCCELLITLKEEPTKERIGYELIL
ncbi:MAG: N-acetyltransferase [Coriobacteriales bacterium]|nr:N-acetyltransferase [Coriobacteriales bacterium]